MRYDPEDESEYWQAMADEAAHAESEAAQAEAEQAEREQPAAPAGIADRSCVHSRPDWRLCPHCNGINAAAAPAGEERCAKCGEVRSYEGHFSPYDGPFDHAFLPRSASGQAKGGGMSDQEKIDALKQIGAILTLIAECDTDGAAKDFPIPRDEMIDIAKRGLAVFLKTWPELKP